MARCGNWPNSRVKIAFATCSILLKDEWRFVDRKGTPASVRVTGNLISNSGETLRRAALEGVGICLAARISGRTTISIRAV